MKLKDCKIGMQVRSTENSFNTTYTITSLNEDSVNVQVNKDSIYRKANKYNNIDPEILLPIPKKGN